MVADAKISQLLDQLFTVVQQLEARFPGRPFTPDGHMVGSLGEVIAAERYGLNLMPPSTKGYDATDAEERRVEIKATFGNKSVSLRDCHADLLLVLRLGRKGFEEEVYFGPAAPAWAAAGRLQDNGQRVVSLSKLRRLRNQAPTVYGLPTTELQAAAERGEVQLGGCLPPSPN